MEEHIQLKRAWGPLTKAHGFPTTYSDAIVDYVAYWSQRTEIPARRFVAWLASPPVSFTTGASGMAWPMNTTLGWCRAQLVASE